MQYVQITVDGITYTLREQSNGDWAVTNKAPYIGGEYPVTVTVTTEAGQVIELDVEDGTALAEALTLIVTEGTTISGERMLNYYPEVIRQILEFQALMKAEGFEVDFLKDSLDMSINDAYLSTMGESRILQWEHLLKITPNADDTLQDRRDSIIARIRGQGKLNTELINAIVGAFTEGTADSYIEDSVLYVEVTPPPNNKQYKFANVERELVNRQPVHLGLVVKRNYATWEEVSANFADWSTVAQLNTWEDLKLYVAPQ